jgi:hypothetical protein
MHAIDSTGFVRAMLRRQLVLTGPATPLVLFCGH